SSSLYALHAALSLFPGRELVAFHAHAMPMAGLAGAPDAVALQRAAQAVEHGDYAAFLAQADLPAGTGLHPAIHMGPVETVLTRYVREHDVDLVVVGSHGRSGLMDLLLGSTAAKLLEWLPCDTLLVSEPRARHGGD